jgi:hypothetical protein
MHFVCQTCGRSGSRRFRASTNTQVGRPSRGAQLS